MTEALAMATPKSGSRFFFQYAHDCVNNSLWNQLLGLIGDVELPASHAVRYLAGMDFDIVDGIGIAAGLIASLLLKLIGLFTNLFFFRGFQRVPAVP